MAMNLGYMEVGGGGVSIRVYYDTAWLEADPSRDPALAPLVDGPRGFCLDVTNTSGRTVRVRVMGLAGNPITANVQQGDPVTNGQGRSRTAVEMAAGGFTTRGSVGELALEPA